MIELGLPIIINKNIVEINIKTKQLIENLIEYCNINYINEAEYKGKKVQLNKPTRGDVKKYKVYVKNPKTGKVIKVNFGDKNMEIKRDDPKRRKSFRARHKCSQKTDKTKAGYWSCKFWGNRSVSSLLEGETKKKSCWKGYRRQGTKMKGGRRVPNCVKESTITDNKIIENLIKYFNIKNNSINEGYYGEEIVKLNIPMAGDHKKYKFYTQDPEVGDIVKVNFGEPDMELSENIDKNGNKYWSCKSCDTEKKNQLTENKISNLLIEKTLYHGTITHNLESIEQNGLIPTIGSFVADSYAGSVEGDVMDYLENLLYATDKQQIDKARTAIIYQIGSKLNKSSRSVTDEDFERYGALCVIKNGDEIFNFHSEKDVEYGRAPLGVETGDYYTDEEVTPDYILTGKKLTNFFKQYGLYPLKKDRLRSVNESVQNEISPSKIIADLKKLSPLFIEAAKKIYDEWEQDENGFSESYGAGGICDDIADAILSIIAQNTNYEGFTFYDEYSYHTSVYVFYCYEDEEVGNTGYLISVDLPYNYYEKGAGYNWTKIQDVEFKPEMISIIDESSYFKNYIDRETCEPFETH